MKPEQVLPSLIARSHISGRELSRRMGKPDTWASKTIARGSASRLDTITEAADVVGIDIALVDRATGKIIGTVAPPRSDSE